MSVVRPANNVAIQGVLAQDQPKESAPRVRTSLYLWTYRVTQSIIRTLDRMPCVNADRRDDSERSLVLQKRPKR